MHVELFLHMLSVSTHD